MSNESAPRQTLGLLFWSQRTEELMTNLFLYQVTFSGFFFFFLWACGFELAKQVLYCLSHKANPFYPGYFGDGGLTN
jgi:hypothetical protein